MKWRIVALSIILISISQVFQAFSQSPSIQQAAQVLQMVPEPVVTMGTSNTVFVEEVLGAKTFLFKELAATEWDTVASSGDPSQSSVSISGLSDGVTYQYQVLFEGDLSNIVMSTQDNTTPIVTSLFMGSLANSSNVVVPFSVVDSVSQSIKKAEFYYRPAHNSPENWRLVESRDYSPAVVASPAIAFVDSFTFSVPDSLGDGEYEFLIVAQDTAWAVDHRPDQPFAGEEGNIVTVDATTPPLLQLFVDVHQPSSEITTQLNRFLNVVAVQIQYNSKDSSDTIVSHGGYLGSGITQIQLFVNYKVDPNGAYVYIDSLYQTDKFSDPLDVDLNGAFNFVATQDGFYEFYTIASDTAGNTENNGQPKLLNLPFVKIDTSLPEIDSITIMEMPGLGDPMSFPKPGWTKSATIAYQILGAADIPKNGYQSNLETINLAEDIAFTVNDSSFSFNVSALSGFYQLTNLAGDKEVFVSVVDSASNTSFPKSDSITFDPNPPLINQFEFPFFLTAVTDLTADVELSDDFTLDSLYIWRNDELIIRMGLPESGTYQSQLDLQIPDQFGLYVFAAQARDKAGNLSIMVKDSVELVNVVNLQQVSFSDLTDTNDDYFAARTGYSDSMTISVELVYSSALRKLHLTDDPSFVSFSELLPPWNVTSATASDTTIQFLHTFIGADGEKTLFFRGIGPNETDTSNVVTDSIIIDTADPSLNGISAYHVVNPNDTTFSYTNSRNIRVRLDTPETQIEKMVFWETGLDSILYEGFSSDTTYSLKILDDGQAELNTAIRDFAGNWSVIRNTDVFLDRQSPNLNTLFFDSPYSSTFQVNINYETEDDTSTFGVGLLDRIRFSENDQFPVNETQQDFLPSEVDFTGNFLFDLQQELGEHTVFAQVRDKAGNWGNILNASIEVVNIVQPQSLELEDVTPLSNVQDAATTGWSNSDTVRVILTYQGVLERIVAAKNSEFTDGKQDYNTWNEINTSTVSFLYDFGDETGVTDLFVKLIGPNIPDTSAVISSSIEIDKIQPVLDDISFYRVLSEGDTTSPYTNSRDIRVRLMTSDSETSKSQIWETGLDSVLYNTFSADTTYFLKTTNDGQLELNARIRDLAGNWSTVKNFQVFLDRQPPLLNALSFDSPFTSIFNVNINYDAEDDTSDFGVGLLDRIRFSENNQFPVNETQQDFLPSVVDVSASFLFDLQQELGEHTVFAQVRDTAGNWGNILNAAIEVVNIVQPQNLVLEDITSLSDVEDAAATGWSNSDTVLVKVTYQDVLRRIVVAKDAAFSIGKQDFDQWTMISNNEVSFIYDFGDESGVTDLFVKLIGPNLPDTSAVISSSIKIDKIDPVLSDFSFYRVLAVGDTTSPYTNSRDIRVRQITSDNETAKSQIWETGMDSVLYNTFASDTTYFLKTTNDGQIELNARIRDLAGNWSTPRNITAFLDRQQPKLNALSFDNPFSSMFQVDINYDAEDDITVSGIGLLDQIRFSENNLFPSEDTQVTSLPMVVDVVDRFPFDLQQQLGEHTVFAQVRDKAGNWGNVLSAQITVVEIVQPTGLTLFDVTPQDDIPNSAFPGWSNTDTVRVVITYDGILKKVLVASVSDFSGDKLDYDVWTTINDSTISVDYAFGNASGLTNLYVKLVGPNTQDTSSVISASIMVDKQAPSLQEVSLFQALTSGDTIFNFANDVNVQIRFNQQSEPLSSAYLWEADGDSVFTSPFHTDENYTFVSIDNEIKTVFATVRDSAGNWSAIYNDTMILDAAPPAISNLILSDASTPGIEDSTITDESNIALTFSAQDMTPGKLFQVTIAQDENFSNNSQSFNFASDLVNQSNSDFSLLYETDPQFYDGNRIICWIVVEDSARNSSIHLTDDILFSAELKITSELFDSNDPNDNSFSSTNTVTLHINEASGLFQEVAFSESVAGLTNWMPATSGETFVTTYTFTSTELFFEGKLFTAARNTAGQFIIDSTSITVDKLVPQLSSITIQAIDPPGENSYTNQSSVSIIIESSDGGLLKEVHLSEDSTFTTFKRIDISTQNTGSFSETVPFNLSSGFGLKTVFARILDQAENESEIVFDGIIADLDPFNKVSNYPNPFNPIIEPTTLVVKSDGSSNIELKIFDLFGNLVRELDAPQGTAYNLVEWDGRNGKGEMVANGGYICVIKVGDETRMRKIAILK